MNLEQLYNDFVTKMLPTIQEGLTITYDYFVDLFGRYVTYLFITDVIQAILWFAIAVGIIFFLLSKFYKQFWKSCREDYSPVAGFILILGGVVVILSVGFSVKSAFNAIKAKYIPEVRVYEEIQHIKAMQEAN